jgi:ankyrin repeat protein
MKPANALKQLQNLPKDLAGTYTRIIQRVPEDNERELKTILMLLAFSARPMTIQEVAEATAVDLESQSFSADDRFGHAYDILDLCSSLVSLADLGADSILKKEMRYKFNWDEDIKIVQFAHFSVKEFILSDVARDSLPETLHINEALSRSYLTEMCLIYLLDFNGGKRATKIDHGEFPFLGYAALHWTTHLTLVATEDREQASKLLLRLFDPGQTGSLINYLNLYNPISSMSIWESQSTGNSGRILNFGTTYRNKQDFETPLYYACYYGLTQVVDALLGDESPVPRSTEELGSPLAAAASMGQEELVRRLLGMGADPNSRYCAQFFRPIHAAVKSGKLSIVKMLLEAGADISSASYGPGYPLENGTALHLAAREGNVECIQALIDGGHEVNYVLRGTGEPGTALAVASQNGKDGAVACLIRNGADPSLSSHWYNYPLNLAAEKCDLRSVEAILGAGANIHGAGNHNPLHEAAVRGDIGIMKFLLDHGADINCPGNTYGTPLKGAIQSRDAAVFQFMLDHGADINERGSSTMYPVDQAIFGGNTKAADILLKMDAKFSNQALAEALGHRTKEYLVQSLLKKGADPNAEDERQGNMLQLAIHERCQAGTIRWLLESGADINAVEGEHGTALQIAVENEQEEIIDLLFEHGVEINLPACGDFGNPLQAAIANRLENVIRLLLEKGADIHAQGGRYWTILQTAARFGNEALVKLLISRGVDVDVIGGEFGTALRAAVAMEHESIVKLLLDASAQVNIEAVASHSTKADSFSSSPFHSTLEVAVSSCNTSIFKLLDNYGMVRTPKTVEDALVRAVLIPGVENNLKMLDCLISTAADVKKYGGKALLFASSWSGKPEVVELLLSFGAPIDWTYESATIGSPLMHAISDENKEVIQVLLDAGADVNLAAGETGTALITAIDKGNKELALDLLVRGADPNIKAGKYGTALAIAAKNGDEDVFFELLRYAWFPPHYFNFASRGLKILFPNQACAERCEFYENSLFLCLLCSPLMSINGILTTNMI